MKSRVLITVAALAPVAWAFAQGTIYVWNNDGQTTFAQVDIDAGGNHYTGVFGIEVWALSSTALPAGINLGPSPGSGVAAYNAMVGSGFAHQLTFAGQWAESGFFFVGGFALPSIPGPEAVLALAIWNTPAPSWEAMLAGANADTRAGVVAFVNPVTHLFTNPALPALLTGWTEDLVMTPIPEPGAGGIAGLGGAILLALRWRRRRHAQPCRYGPSTTEAGYEKSNS